MEKLLARTFKVLVSAEERAVSDTSGFVETLEIMINGVEKTLVVAKHYNMNDMELDLFDLYTSLREARSYYTNLERICGPLLDPESETYAGDISPGEQDEDLEIINTEQEKKRQKLSKLDEIHHRVYDVFVADTSELGLTVSECAKKIQLSVEETRRCAYDLLEHEFLFQTVTDDQFKWTGKKF